MKGVYTINPFFLSRGFARVLFLSRENQEGYRLSDSIEPLDSGISSLFGFVIAPWIPQIGFFSGAAFIRREVACWATDLYKGKPVHDIREVSERLYFLIRFNVPKWNSKLYVRRKSFSGSGALPPTFPPKLSKLPCVIFPIARLSLSPTSLPSLYLPLTLSPFHSRLFVF